MTPTWLADKVRDDHFADSGIWVGAWKLVLVLWLQAWQRENLKSTTQVLFRINNLLKCISNNVINPSIMSHGQKPRRCPTNISPPVSIHFDLGLFWLGDVYLSDTTLWITHISISATKTNIIIVSKLLLSKAITFFWQNSNEQNSDF